MFRMASPLARETPSPPSLQSGTSHPGVLNKALWNSHGVTVQRDSQTEEGTNNSPFCRVLVRSSGLWAIAGWPTENRNTRDDTGGRTLGEPLPRAGTRARSSLVADSGSVYSPPPGKSSSSELDHVLQALPRVRAVLKQREMGMSWKEDSGTMLGTFQASSR